MAVVGKRLYHFGRVDGRERLSCLDAGTGRTHWDVEEEAPYADVFGYGDGPRATPLVDGERVYTHGVNGLLHCRSAIDGHTLWRVDTVNEHGAQPGMYGFGGSPVVHAERLIQLAGNDTRDSGILVLNKFDGSLVYCVPSSPASYASPRLAAINNQTWCLAFMRDGLVAFDVDRGDRTFEFPWHSTLIFDGVHPIDSGIGLVAGDVIEDVHQVLAGRWRERKFCHCSVDSVSLLARSRRSAKTMSPSIPVPASSSSMPF